VSWISHCPVFDFLQYTKPFVCLFVFLQYTKPFVCLFSCSIQNHLFVCLFVSFAAINPNLDGGRGKAKNNATFRNEYTSLVLPSSTAGTSIQRCILTHRTAS